MSSAVPAVGINAARSDRSSSGAGGIEVAGSHVSVAIVPARSVVLHCCIITGGVAGATAVEPLGNAIATVVRVGSSMV